MIYIIVKILLRISLPVFYKKPVFNNLRNLPSGRPVIIASNHPNAFMDALLIGTFAKQRTHFLVRSDVFSNPVLRWIYGKLNMIPIYRIQEGIQHMHKNEDTFNICNELLHKNESIIVFPEGICVQERRLRPLKKGSARIIFTAATSETIKKEPVILPVGINYERPKNFRSRVFINYGEPLSVSGFLAMYKQDKVLAMNQFTRELEKQMSSLLIHIENKTNDRLVEDLEEIYRTQLLQSRGLNPENAADRYLASREITTCINYFYKKDHAKIESLKHKTYHYIRKLEKLKLRDHLLRKTSVESLTVSSFISDMLILAAGLPFHLAGLLINYLPYRLAYTIAGKTVKKEEFHSSVNLGAGMGLFLIFYIILLAAVAYFSKNLFYTAALLALIPLFAACNLAFWPLMKKIAGRYRLRRLLKQNKRKVASLIRQRKEIIIEFGEMLESCGQ